MPHRDKGTPFVAVVEQLKQWSDVWMTNEDDQQQGRRLVSMLLWHLNENTKRKKNRWDPKNSPAATESENTTSTEIGYKK